MGLGSNRGNVLFLILLAVVLFAALSYAVTQSNRSGGNNISDEDARLAASQITQYATLLESIVTRLRLINGCRDTQISFAYDSDGDGNWYDSDDAFHNPNAPTDFRCHVFHKNAGGIALPNISQSWAEEGLTSSWVVSSSHCFQNVGTDCAGPEGLELFFAVRHIRDDLCTEINRSLGHTSLGTTIPTEQFAGGSFVGSYIWTNPGSHDVGGQDTYATYLSGAHSGCFEDTFPVDAPYNYFFHVLIPR